MKQEEARKKHSIWKGFLSSLLTGADALTWGIPILGLPQAEEIVSARATFAGSTAEVKPADMELAQNLPGVLHAWFGRAEERMPQAVMTYTLADGSEVVYAVEPSSEKEGSYVVTEVPVTTGLETDFYIEVSGDGITDGLSIVSDPQSVAPGMEVTPDFVATGTTPVTTGLSSEPVVGLSSESGAE